MLALRITGAQIHAARALVGADVEMPERKLAVTWSLRRKTEKGLPATPYGGDHVQATGAFGGISNVPGILMKEGARTRDAPKGSR